MVSTAAIRAAFSAAFPRYVSEALKRTVLRHRGLDPVMEGNPCGLGPRAQLDRAGGVNSLPGSLAAGAGRSRRPRTDGDIAFHRWIGISGHFPPDALSRQGFWRGNQQPRQEPLIPQDRAQKEMLPPRPAEPLSEAPSAFLAGL